MHARNVLSALLTLFALFIFHAVGFAQFGPEAPMLAHQTLSPFGIDAPDAVETGLFTFNPAAAVGAKDYQIRNFLELDGGRISFDNGPGVDTYIQTYWGSSGNNYFRIARYDFESDIAPMPRILPPGVSAQFAGEAWALTYAREDFGVRWGVTWYPRNESTTRLFVDTPAGPQPIAHGEAESDLCGRVGFQVPVTDDLTFGAAYHRDESDTWFLPPPSLAQGGANGLLTGSYETDVVVVGLAWRPRLGTTVSLDFENGDIEGPNVSESINIWYVALEQFLSPKFSVKITNLDQAWGVGLNYYKSADYILGMSFGPSGFRRTGEYLGHADVFYGWFATTW
ncbi:MAG: hypothetical protein HPY44_21645 [Armatimonadetes bacterium]|nr:hypothetical protein [Armatimonadota bacterium]